MKGKRHRKLFAWSIIVWLMLVMLNPTVNSSIISTEVNGTPAGWTNDTRLTNSISPDANPSIAAYQDDVHIVWRDIWLGNGRVFYKNSTDDGQTWSNQRQLNIGGQGDYPDIAINTTNLHVVYDDNIGVSSKEIAYCNSTDGGISWSSPKYISVDDGFNSEGAIIAVNNSNLHAIWVDTRFGFLQSEVYYRRSIDGGITWDNALGANTDRRITHDLSGASYIDMDINGSNIHVLFCDGRNGNFDVYYTRSVDNGVTWDNGTATDEEILLTTNVTDHAWSSIAVNESTVHVIWLDQVWPGPVYYMYYRNSADNGVTWNPPQLLSGPYSVISNPDMTVWGNNINVVWADMRDDGSTSEIYFKNSSDGGASWNPDFRITYNEGNDSWQPKMALTNNKKHIVWHDKRDGNDELYYKRFPEALPDTELPEIAPVPVTSANIGEIINITANITDDIGVDSVFLDYIGVNGTHSNVSMNKWNGNWSYDIPGQANIGFVDYFIWASDTSGNANMTGINQTQINDITKPEINHIPITSKNISEIINITANITDDVEVNKVFLNFTDVHGANQNITMNEWAGNYSFDIPGQSNTGFVSYYVWANDTSDNKNMTTISQIQIYDVTDPEINHVPVTSANVSEIINITANVTDDVSVNSVHLNYTDVNGTNYNVSMQKWNGNYSYEISGQIIAGNLSYFIWANDTDGNWNQTQIYQVQINEMPVPLDTIPPEIEHVPVSAINVSEEINITAVITDDVEVDAVYLNYTGIDGINHNVSMTLANGNCSYEIPGQSYVGNVLYFIWANDTFGNANQTDIYQIQINEVIIPDTIPPTIASTLPTGINVLISTTITITFDEPMNILSVQNAITISPAITISGYSWNTDKTTITITPSGNLSYNTTYNITIGIGAEDIAGNSLENPYSWEFTTVEAPEIIESPAPQHHWWIGILIFFTSIAVLIVLRKMSEQR